MDEFEKRYRHMLLEQWLEDRERCDEQLSEDDLRDIEDDKRCHRRRDMWYCQERGAVSARRE